MKTASDNPKSVDNPNKGLSSAEQQRLQFQREHEEIELQQRKFKTSSEAGLGLKSMKFEDLQGKSNINLSSGHTTGYHDECDQLMDELASTSGIKCNSNNGNLNDSVQLIRQSQKQQEGHVTDAAVGNQTQAIGIFFFCFTQKSDSLSSLGKTTCFDDDDDYDDDDALTVLSDFKRPRLEATSAIVIVCLPDTFIAVIKALKSPTVNRSISNIDILHLSTTSILILLLVEMPLACATRIVQSKSCRSQHLISLQFSSRVIQQ